MGQWLSWLKSNEKQLLGILDDLAKKAVETASSSSVANMRYIEDSFNAISAENNSILILETF